jgi:hypothetical protein
MARAIQLAKARAAGIPAVCLVVAVELFNGTVCYKHEITGYLVGLGFVAMGFAPGLIGLSSRNPLRTVGAALFFVPWLMLAFYTDCVRPYQGGGASMVYIAVVVYGFISSAVGALLTGLLMRLARCTVVSH